MAEWWDVFENYPPGLKDIVLDKWLTEKNTVVFMEIVEQAAFHAETLENRTLKNEITKFYYVLKTTK